MRKKTVRSGLRFIALGIACVMVATFFHAELSRLLFLDMFSQARVMSAGFLVGGITGAWGVLVAAAGLLQSGSDEPGVRLAPTVLLLFSLIILFFVLFYNSISIPQSPSLQPGESIDI